MFILKHILKYQGFPDDATACEEVQGALAPREVRPLDERMALDASFWINAHASPDEMKALLAISGDFSSIDDLGSAKRLSADGILVFISAERDEIGYLQDADIRAGRKIYFSCSDKTKSAIWTLNVFHAVTLLLRTYDGDALLIYAPDYPTLLRKNGELTLDERRGLWSKDVEPQVLPLIDQPYRFGIVPPT